MNDTLAGAPANEPAAAAAAPVMTGDDVTQPPAPVASPENAGSSAPSGNASPDGAEAEAVKGAWPEDWRSLLAAGDEKKLERLGRFGSPADVWKAWEEAQKKISEGLKPRQKPAPNASEEEWAEYRKTAGIPEAVEEYVKAIELPDKRQIGEDDLPVIQAFAERAIKRGVSPGDMAELVDEYYAIQEEQWSQVEERDAEFRRDAERQLKEEYGGDFKANINAMRPYFESVDSEMFDNLMGGRLADGSRIGDNPNLIRFFVRKALDENPAATILPVNGSSVDTIEGEIKTLETRMREDRNGWFKDEKAQRRLEQLYEARDKLASK
jgi:hypothetical protein